MRFEMDSQKIAQIAWSVVAAFLAQLGIIPSEDGMEIKTVQFNSKDAQWAEAVKLSREDCAAVYHVHPAMIWPGSGQT